MDRETLKSVITELFNHLEERVKGRLLLMLALNAIEAIALNSIDALLDRFKMSNRV